MDRTAAFPSIAASNSFRFTQKIPWSDPNQTQPSLSAMSEQMLSSCSPRSFPTEANRPAFNRPTPAAEYPIHKLPSAVPARQRMGRLRSALRWRLVRYAVPVHPEQLRVQIGHPDGSGCILGHRANGAAAFRQLIVLELAVAQPLECVDR